MEADAFMSDTEYLSDFGRRLAAYRISRRLTQADLAKLARVSKRTVERVEAGHSTQFSNLLAVIRALGLLSALDGILPPLPPGAADGSRRRRARGNRPAIVAPIVMNVPETVD